MPKREIVDLTGELVKPFETPSAYRFFDGDKTVWLPKSQVEWDPADKVMTMPIWLAQEKGLI
jgi:hypothetical protein